MKQGKPVEAMLRFIDNLYQNPQQFAIEELYDWMRGCKLPITDDGCFMAYKRVRDDFKDCYTGKIDNSPARSCSCAGRTCAPTAPEPASRGCTSVPSPTCRRTPATRWSP